MSHPAGVEGKWQACFAGERPHHSGNSGHAEQY